MAAMSHKVYHLSSIEFFSHSKTTVEWVSRHGRARGVSGTRITDRPAHFMRGVGWEKKQKTRLIVFWTIII